MRSAIAYHDVVIEAPDGPAALALEHRLAHLSPVSISHEGRWTVDVPAVESPIEVEAAVAAWLAEIGLESTAMSVDDRPLTIEARRIRRRRAINAGFIG